MKKILLCFNLIGVCSFGQVGIGTTLPQATLDVEGLPNNANAVDGIMAPRLTAVQLRAKDNIYTTKQNGAVIFVTEVDNVNTAKTIHVTNPGYYYYSHAANQTQGVWVKMNGNSQKKEFFYMPSILLPTSTNDERILDPANVDYILSGDGLYTVDLYSLFNQQFLSPIVTSTDETIDDTTILQGFVLDRNNYDYVITYADANVFQDIAVNSDGILTYKVDNDVIIRDRTFMNIVLKVK